MTKGAIKNSFVGKWPLIPRACRVVMRGIWAGWRWIFHVTQMIGRKDTAMAIKVLVRRKFKKGDVEAAYKLLMQLRAAATLMPGFISGETIISAEEPNTLLVISTWTGKRRWEDWRATETRKEFAKKIAELLETSEQSEFFYAGERIPEWVDMA
jgi:quinol monooxygenase YgiN